MLEIRAMKKDEAQEVVSLGKKTFEWFESLFITTPKRCFVAIEDGRIIGAVTYKYYEVANKKIGYVDFIFVDTSGHGKGVGSKLTDICLEKMKKEGCDGYSAIVRDDNVGSWKMFINNGLQRVGIMELAKQFGILGMLKISFQTPLFVATGMEFYLKLEENSVNEIKRNSTIQILKYLTYSAILSLPTLLYGFERAFYIIGIIVVVLSIRLLFGFLGTLFSNEEWNFRVCDGGFMIPVISSFMGGNYLISGNWYPQNYRKEKDFKRSLGLTALLQWFSLFLLIIISKTEYGKFDFINAVGGFSHFLIFISVIPYYPLASFGGKRIVDWNKWIYIFVLFITIGIIIIGILKT